MTRLSVKISTRMRHMNTTTCNCELCQGLDAKRERALAWLGDRWLLAPKPKMVRASEIVYVDVNLEALTMWAKPKLTLVKS